MIRAMTAVRVLRVIRVMRLDDGEGNVGVVAAPSDRSQKVEPSPDG